MCRVYGAAGAGVTGPRSERGASAPCRKRPAGPPAWGRHRICAAATRTGAARPSASLRAGLGAPSCLRSIAAWLPFRDHRLRSVCVASGIKARSAEARLDGPRRPARRPPKHAPLGGFVKQVASLPLLQATRRSREPAVISAVAGIKPPCGLLSLALSAAAAANSPLRLPPPRSIQPSKRTCMQPATTVVTRYKFDHLLKLSNRMVHSTGVSIRSWRYSPQLGVELVSQACQASLERWASVAVT